MLAGQALKAIK